MTHEDKGHYAAKHDGIKRNETIIKKIQALADNNCLSCILAHKAGKALNVSPADIGIQTDLIEYRIVECQLGLFGYARGQKKIDPDIKITPELSAQLETTNNDGRISCLDCWDIARSLKIKKTDVSSACEKKNIRIKPCQLGAF